MKTERTGSAVVGHRGTNYRELSDYVLSPRTYNIGGEKSLIEMTSDEMEFYLLNQNEKQQKNARFRTRKSNKD